MANNYVRFLRGTPTGFEALQVKDNNTLYFISVPNSATGKLYLGNKLIAGDSASGIAPTSLADLTNVIINETQAGSILVMDEDGKWQARTPQEVAASLGISVMVGATDEKDGVSGLVPTPQISDKNLFLRGDATWANPVGDMESKLNKLIGVDTDKTLRAVVAEEIANALIEEDAAESLDTLQEIAAWIQQHPKDASEMNQKITSLEEALNGAEGKDGLKATVEDLSATLNGKDDDLGLVTRVENLETKVGSLDTLVSTHTKEIATIKDRLVWHELQDDGQEKQED